MKLSQVGEVTDAANALTAPSASAPVMDFDLEEHRMLPEAHLVGQAEAESGFPLVHRQHNVELRVEPQR